MKVKKIVINIFIFCVATVVGFGAFTTLDSMNAFAMPFYSLKPQEITLRATFYTTYSNSTNERKSNIQLASKYLNNTFVDVGGEFSFNKTVGERCQKRGFKMAKIIVNGEFVEGVGGGVCQVSSTLYNAILLAGLKVTEFHPHSLPVSYVAPSFDAMVNSGSADLRFINDTDNPIIINCYADEDRITISIYGQKLDKTYKRVSVVKETIPAPENKEVFDEKGEYPDLFEGQFKVLKYGKEGYKSEGYLIVNDGKNIYTKKIRSDKYNAIAGLIVWGKGVQKSQEQIEEEQNANFSYKVFRKVL